jgi:hypothetical protein
MQDFNGFPVDVSILGDGFSRNWETLQVILIKWAFLDGRRYLRFVRGCSTPQVLIVSLAEFRRVLISGQLKVAPIRSAEIDLRAPSKANSSPSMSKARSIYFVSLQHRSPRHRLEARDHAYRDGQCSNWLKIRSSVSGVQQGPDQLAIRRRRTIKRGIHGSDTSSTLMSFLPTAWILRRPCFGIQASFIHSEQCSRPRKR